MTENPILDLFVIGGGVNGCGIARDAAGRGLSVALAEMADLAQGTSSASTKLFHGGLRYLEYFKFRLVRESLIEREILLQAMPHIAWPMRFVLPLSADMRFENDTPTARLLALVMPWAKGRRPDWLIRLGLFMYDHMGGRKILPATRNLDLSQDVAGQGLQSKYERAFEYSDCWVQDSRLVVLNARDAGLRGARIMTRTRVIAARREGGLWIITTESRGITTIYRARALVNAAGPWVARVLGDIDGHVAKGGIRLVRGSHIVTRRLFDHDRCYFFQGPDGRIIFAIPYEQDFTLIGTTDAEHADPDTPPEISAGERDYLIAFANRYLREPITPDDIVWSYSGVRPLYDDGASSASAATRDYVLQRDAGPDGTDAPLLNVFGGKITTYRRLAESALAKLRADFPTMAANWTAGVALPGGDFPVDGVLGLIQNLRDRHPSLTQATAQRLVRAYGTEAMRMLGDPAIGPGQDFGAGLTEAEVRWLMKHEFARNAQDVIWRRSRLGLRLTTEQVANLDAAMAEWAASGTTGRGL